MPYIRSHNTRIYYETHGAGEPLLFLHGWNDSIASFSTNLVQRLKTRYRIILLDLPGYGKSGRIELSFERLSTIIDTLLDRLKIRQVSLMGFCMGAIISLDYTIRNEDRIKELLLIETYIEYPLILYPLMINQCKKTLLRFFRFNRIGIHLTKKYLLLDKPYRKDFTDSFQTGDETVSLDYIRTMWQYSTIDHYKRMKSLSIPVMIVVGDKTSRTIRKAANKIGSNIKHSRIITVDNAGHFPIEENPEALSKLL
ncbi:MAG: alpha/beta fold hydrolase [Nanobdellota archaeon]